MASLSKASSRRKSSCVLFTTQSKVKPPPPSLISLSDIMIAGHMKLYLQQILHRDITIDTILLGKKADGSPADPGYCGLLIDLYMAIRIGRDTNKLSSERRSVCSNTSSAFIHLTEPLTQGSRLYLSIAALLCCKTTANNPFTLLAHPSHATQYADPLHHSLLFPSRPRG